MQIQGPFSWDELKTQAIDEEYTKDIQLEEYWIKFIPEEQNLIDSRLLTPMSKSASLLRLEEIWEPSLETPNTPVVSKVKFTDVQADAQSPSPPMLIGCSQVDLFRNLDQTMAPSSIQKHLIEDDDLIDATGLTPLALRSKESNQTELGSDIDLLADEDDMFNDIDDKDLNVGFTQMQTSLQPIMFVPDSAAPATVGFVTGRNMPIKPPCEQKLKEAAEKLEIWTMSPSARASSKRMSDQETFRIGKKRPSELFQDIEVAVSTPKTPFDISESCKRSSLGISILGHDDNFSQSSFFQQTNALGSEGFGGFKLASGAKIKEPSAESFEKAKRLIEDPIPIDPVVHETSFEGFKLANGNKVKESSPESIKQANRLFSKLQAFQDTLAPAFTGFATAAGKKVNPPSRESLKRAEDLIGSIDRENAKIEANNSTVIIRTKQEQSLPLISKRKPIPRSRVIRSSNPAAKLPHSIAPKPLSKLISRSIKHQNIFDCSPPEKRIQLGSLAKRTM